jgi:hypothetical protein
MKQLSTEHIAQHQMAAVSHMRYNHLPSYIKTLSNDLRHFKSELKSFLIEHTLYSLEECYQVTSKWLWSLPVLCTIIITIYLLLIIRYIKYTQFHRNTLLFHMFYLVLIVLSILWQMTRILVYWLYICKDNTVCYIYQHQCSMSDDFLTILYMYAIDKFQIQWSLYLQNGFMEYNKWMNEKCRLNKW